MKRLIYTLVAALMVTSLACGGRLSQVPRFDEKEPVFWRVCYDALGQPTDYDGDCEHPQEITWKLPVLVHVPADYPDRLAFAQAMAIWNEWLGAEVFKLVDFRIAADIRVSYEPVVLWYAGVAFHDRTEGRVVFDLRLVGKYASDVEVTAHELGHALGLAHDGNRPRSVMFPSTETILPYLTRKDCYFLKAKYRLDGGCR